ncbi:MAG TPA: hypothetical protein VMS98_06580 [Thermoanaerobaculia bacterium]|nr:hypothetical protein [Thermoanaerobaculia bacterium]
MKIALLIAAVLAAATAVAHSVLGERYILTRLFRRENLPRLFGSDWFTKRTLRFAWHLTSVAWLGLAGVVALLAQPTTPSPETILRIVSITFLVSAAVTAIASNGRHLAWPVFLAVALLTWFMS